MVHGWPNLSGSVDSVFLFIMGIAVTLLVGVTGVMIYFVIHYSRKRNPNPEDIEDNILLEVTWTVIPTILVLLIFYYGWTGFKHMRAVPENAMLVKVTARMWSWLFSYENGKQSDVLKVPLMRPVKLVMSSQDVIHSLFIPAFRIKEDAVPGRETHLWFLPDETGTFDLFCTEYCGVGHSSMITKVVVMTGPEFDAWYTHAGNAGRHGIELLQEKGCLGCHSTDGSRKVGPTFKAIFGRKERVVTNGKEREITIDEAYLRQSVLDPQADIVKGYPPVMPKLPVTDEELHEIIASLQAMK